MSKPRRLQRYRCDCKCSSNPPVQDGSTHWPLQDQQQEHAAQLPQQQEEHGAPQQHQRHQQLPVLPGLSHANANLMQLVAAEGTLRHSGQPFGISMTGLTSVPAAVQLDLAAYGGANGGAYGLQPAFQVREAWW